MSGNRVLMVPTTVQGFHLHGKSTANLVKYQRHPCTVQLKIYTHKKQTNFKVMTVFSFLGFPFSVVRYRLWLEARLSWARQKKKTNNNPKNPLFYQSHIKSIHNSDMQFAFDKKIFSVQRIKYGYIYFLTKIHNIYMYAQVYMEATA